MKSLYQKKLDKIYKKLDNIALKGKENFMEYYKYIDELIEKGDYDVFSQCLYVFYKIDINDIKSVDTVKKTTWDKVLFQTDDSFLKKLKFLYDQKKVYQTSYNIFSSDNTYINLSLSQPLSITYSSTGLTQSISISETEDIAYITLLNPQVKKLEIYESTWINGEPTSSKFLRNFVIGTNSGQYPFENPINSDISVQLEKQYLIKTEERVSPTSVKFSNYKFEISKSNYLGKIIENEVFTPDAKYYIQNKQYARVVGARKTYLEVYKVDNSTPTGFATSSIYAYDDLTKSEEQNLFIRYTQAIDYLNS
jgi:hypothetical protein